MKDNYYSEVIARAIMFTKNINELLGLLEEIFKTFEDVLPDLLNDICMHFLEYGNKGYLSRDSKSNIYIYANSINRFGLSFYSLDAHYEFYPDIIRMLNEEDLGKNIIQFYRQELSLRRNNKKFYSDERLLLMADDIRSSIASDLGVLYTYSKLSDEEYKKRQLPFIASPQFAESVRYLTTKYPSILQNESFKNRVLETLEAKESVHKKYRNPLKRFTLTHENTYFGQIRFKREDKKLYLKIKG